MGSSKKKNKKFKSKKYADFRLLIVSLCSFIVLDLFFIYMPLHRCDFFMNKKFSYAAIQSSKYMGKHMVSSGRNGRKTVYEYKYELEFLGNDNEKENDQLLELKFDHSPDKPWKDGKVIVVVYDKDDYTNINEYSNYLFTMLMVIEFVLLLIILFVILIGSILLEKEKNKEKTREMNQISISKHKDNDNDYEKIQNAISKWIITIVRIGIVVIAVFIVLFVYFGIRCIMLQ